MTCNVWHSLMQESAPAFGQLFVDPSGRQYKFFGLVDDGEDYYFGMHSKEHGLLLLSCVGSLETHGMTPAQEAA